MPRPQWSLATPPNGAMPRPQSPVPRYRQMAQREYAKHLRRKRLLATSPRPTFSQAWTWATNTGTHTERTHTPANTGTGNEHRDTHREDTHTGEHRDTRTPGHTETGLRCVPVISPKLDCDVCPGVFVPCRMRSPFATTPMRLVCGSTGGRHRGQAWQASGTGIDAVVAWINGVGNSAARATHASHLHSSMRAGHADIAGRGRSAYEQQDSTSSSASAEAV